jgi:hypothetical protein
VATTEQTGFRWGDEAPQFLQGKTPAETLDIVNRLVSATQHMYAQQQQQPSEPVQTPRNEINDDLLVTDPAAWRQQFQAQVESVMAAQMAQAAAPILTNQAATVAELSRNDAANKDVAAKWWNEVEQMVAPVPLHMRSKALYDQACKLARSNHIDEIARERADALAAAGTGVEGVTSRRTPEQTESEKKVWDRIASSDIGKHMLDKYGKAKIEKAAAGMGGLDKYADYVAGSKTQFDPERQGRWSTELS